jgi:hypothetical protein
MAKDDDRPGARPATTDETIEELIGKAAADIVRERRRQVEGEGFDATHDDSHVHGELALAAASYAYASTLNPEERQDHRDALYGLRRGFISIVRLLWRWEAHWFKPQSRRADLVRAGALVIAEIERLDRADRAESEFRGRGRTIVLQPGEAADPSGRVKRGGR